MKKQIKVSLSNENHIMNAPETYTEFVSEITERFKFSSLYQLKIFYLDNVDDLIIVTDQSDYELAFDPPCKRVHFYVGDSAESVRKYISSNPRAKECCNIKTIPDSDLVESKYLSKSPETNSPYVCIGCDGRKTNRKGTKNCRICGGTGLLPEAFIERIKSAVKNEMKLSPKVEETPVTEKLTKPEISTKKSETKGVVYKLELKKDKTPKFFADMISSTIKDGYVVEPGDVFEQIWVMKNKGRTSWPKETALKAVSGDSIETTISPVGEIKSGENVKISVIIKAPEKPGRYVTYFRLNYGNEMNFGQKPWIDFIVQEPMKVNS